MSTIWCPQCCAYVGQCTAGLTCGHGAIKPVDTYSNISAVVHGGDDATGSADAKRPARSGDELLEGAAPSCVPDGLNAEHAERLAKSGDDVLDEKLVNHGQGALSDEIWAVLDRMVKQHHITHTDVVGALEIIKHDMIHNARDQSEDEEGDDQHV